MLRYLKGTRDDGLFMSIYGDEGSLLGWSDAGFAGISTKSQSGMLMSWAGATSLWRSSRQTVSSVSTAEAELVAAALAWQILEGFNI